MNLTGYVIAALVCATSWKISHAVSLDCTFDMFPFHLVGTTYRCEAKLIHDGENDDKITAVYGTHLPGKGNADVEGLIIVEQKMEFFPVNIDSFFPRLKLINFPLNSISTVTNAHLAPFPNLEFLALFKNRITSLDSDLFSGLNSLKFINLGRNRIQHVGYDFVLPPTAIIYLYANRCIDRDAVTSLEVTFLRFSLMMNCPPKIPEIDTTIESPFSEMREDEKQILKIKYLQLEARLSFVDAFIDSTRCLQFEDPSVR